MATFLFLFGLGGAAFVWWRNMKKAEEEEAEKKKSQNPPQDKVEATPNADVTAPKAAVAAPKAVAAAPQAVAAAPKPVAAAPQAVAAAPKPVAAAPQAVAAAPKPVAAAPQAVAAASKPVAAVPKAVEVAPKAVAAAPKAVEVAPKAVAAAPQAVAAAPKASAPTPPPSEISNVDDEKDKDGSSTPKPETSSDEGLLEGVLEEFGIKDTNESTPPPAEISNTEDEIAASDAVAEPEASNVDEKDKDESSTPKPEELGNVLDLLKSLAEQSTPPPEASTPPEASHPEDVVDKDGSSTPKQEQETNKDEVVESSAPKQEPETNSDEVVERSLVQAAESSTPPPTEITNTANESAAVAEEDKGKATEDSTPPPHEEDKEGSSTPKPEADTVGEEGGIEVTVTEVGAKSTDDSTPPPEDSHTEDEIDEGFPTPEYENSSDLVDVVQGDVPQELTDAVAYLNSLNTSDVDSCQKLMTADTFKYLLKAVKGIRNEDGQIEETLPFHALSILAQIHTRGLSRNERRVAENCASEFRYADGLNVVYDVSTSSSHQPSKQLAAVLTAFNYAYEPLPEEYHDILPTLLDIVVEYDKDASSYFPSSDPQSHQAERIVALALHALTLLLCHDDNVHLILEDSIGRAGPEDDGGDSGNLAPQGGNRRGFSSSSPLPRARNYDPSSPNLGTNPADTPQSQRTVAQSGGAGAGEVPDLPLSMLQEKIYELVSAEDRNIAAWAIRFYAIQALHMTLNEKRAFVAETSFFDKARELVTLPLNDETLPVVENTILALYNICLNRYDKGKSFILKTGIAKELFTNLVRIDFKQLSNPERGHLKPLDDEETYIPDSLVEPLTALSPSNVLFTAEEQSRYVDHQVHTMAIAEHTFAVFRSFSHNIMSLEYLLKIGIATPISNILYNYNRKITQSQVLAEASEDSYGRFLAAALELFRYLAAVGVDEVIQGKANELRLSLEKIQAIKVLENLLQNLQWDTFDYSQELEELDYTRRGLLDLAFTYPALYAADDAPEEARPAFDFINQLRASDSPLVSPEKPSLYVKYFNHLFTNVNNAYSF